MESKPHDEGLAGLAAHINDYWEQRMRSQLFALLDQGGAGLRPLVIEPRPDQAAYDCVTRFQSIGMSRFSFM